jgi:hypothetical protein
MIFCVNALESSKWEASQPKSISTSDGIIIDYDLSEVSSNSYYFEGNIVVNITIPENYDSDTIVIAPTVFEELSNYLFQSDSMIMGSAFQPGDKVTIDFNFNNLSSYTYNYDDTSFNIFPKEDIVYHKIGDSTSSSQLFNGLTTSSNYHFYRTYNTALQSLIPNSKNSLMTDINIDSALKMNGYSGISDYSLYLLNFYNDKYSTDYTRLDQFPNGIIREILGQNDPLYTNNSAFRNLKIFISSFTKKSDVDIAVKRAGYSDVTDYILSYYNNKYGSNATRIVDLSNEALDDFFSVQGIESSGKFILETNADVLALSYDYFYNKCLSFGFNEDDSNNYSIGSYMRDESLGDSSISSISALGPNSLNSVTGNLSTSGNYILNSYMNYEFMVDMFFKFTGLRGSVVSRFIDEDGNTLVQDVVTSGMVGKDYNTSSIDIEGYHLERVVGDESGKYIDGEIQVVYVYSKSSDVDQVIAIPSYDDSENFTLSRGYEIIPPKTGISNNYSFLLSSLILIGYIKFRRL